NAVSLNASAWQLASIVGPVAGGLLYGLGGGFAYGTAVAFLLVALACVTQIKAPVQSSASQARSLDTLFAGFRYIFKEKVVLGAIATALWLARYPVRDHAGVVLFIFVGGFGLFTAMFGMSNQAWLSIPLLGLIGACDMVSVSIRETIMQLWTPDSVRGRVNAVNSVFIGASNELGEFRAGMMATLIGTAAAVAVGGAATVVVAGLWSQLFPGLRDQRSLDRKMVAG